MTANGQDIDEITFSSLAASCGLDPSETLMYRDLFNFTGQASFASASRHARWRKFISEYCLTPAERRTLADMFDEMRREQKAREEADDKKQREERKKEKEKLDKQWREHWNGERHEPSMDPFLQILGRPAVRNPTLGKVVRCGVCHGSGNLPVSSLLNVALNAQWTVPCVWCGGRGVIRIPQNSY
jgi:hypothetical protein